MAALMMQLFNLCFCNLNLIALLIPERRVDSEQHVCYYSLEIQSLLRLVTLE